MTRNEKKKRQLRKLYRHQKGKCHWCQQSMLHPDMNASPAFQKKQNDRQCTIDHLDDRYSPERGQHSGELRKVAACFRCNNDRNKARQASMPREFLWQQSGAYPKQQAAE